ncbi:hypothetical protein HER10_EVM0003249 [Colletotrichum scovillei]|uniref:uncharacterized protein n=1 Tax=Colletotrichum scovillei TaxID=1209932 RepID=UPI0015C3DEF3|nr:uncharacterized protein HER10_EVM0003249 [Colletotrichum scovillei]KAF4773680.1 hypothetical protein HER10_EVM0003249 [Colletotrichum scovillei]
MDTEDGYEDEAEAASSSSLQATFQRACDICRARKIRCNRERPCSHCVSNNVECTQTDTIRPRIKHKRILLTSQYEQKIDQIDSRLNEAIGLLKGLHDTLNTGSGAPYTTPKPTSMFRSTELNSSSITVVEGESSLAAQFSFADDFIRKVAKTEPLQTSGLEMGESLENLSQIVAAYKQQPVSEETTYPNARPTERPGLHTWELPPIQESVAVIHVAKSQRLAGTGWIYEYLPMNQFATICLDVYFTENYSEMDFIIVNAGLHSMFKDYSTIVIGDERERCERHSLLCCANLETALSNLPLHMPAVPKAIIALLFGAFHAIELSKPFLAWTLSSKASEICQTLGYHRESSLNNGRNEDDRLRKFLFWSNYFIDKSLSLRLGRASTIPEWTITVTRPSIMDSHPEPALAYFVLWVEAARCQGKIYELLYSPDSVRQRDEERRSRVQSLISDLENLDKATSETNKKWIKTAADSAGQDLMDFYATSDETLRLSLLTLVHRAAPQDLGSPMTFSPDCVNAARATIEKHKDCIAVMKRSGDAYFPAYFQWTLLFAPFVPFVVIFCHVIETVDQADLGRLDEFVASIKDAACISSAATRVHRLFNALHGIALRYIEYRSVQSYDNQSQSDPEVDWVLATPALPPIWDEGGNQQLQESGPNILRCNAAVDNRQCDATTFEGISIGVDENRSLMRMGHQMELESWFYNSEAMTGILKQYETKSTEES